MSKPLRNFDKFEEGHYYVYTGEKTDKWANAMEAVLERKIHKCLETPCSNKEGAIFEGVEDGYWNYKDGFDNWVEVENPNAVFEVGDDCLRYGKTHQYWKVAKVHERYFHNDKTKNGYNNEVGIHYICKRKHNKKEEPITKSSNGVCKYCGKDTITFFFINQEGSILKLGCRCRNCANSYDLIKSTPFGFKLELDGDKIVTYRDYDLNIIKQLDKLDALNAKENVPRETPIKVSLESVVKEPITFNFDFKRDKAGETAKALSDWMNLWTDKRKDVDKKEGNSSDAPKKLNVTFKFADSFSDIEHFQKWLKMDKELDKKDNVFKKYIRNKKYMKFVKEKKK